MKHYDSRTWYVSSVKDDYSYITLRKNIDGGANTFRVPWYVKYALRMAERRGKRIIRDQITRALDL